MIKRPIFAIAGSFVLGEVLALLNVADISRIYGGLGAALLGCSLTLGKWRSRSGDSFLLFLRCSLGKICLFLCMAAAFGMGYGRAERETARFHREAEGARRLADVRSLVRGKVVRIQEKENGTNLILEHASARTGWTEVYFRRISVFVEEGDLPQIGWTVELRGRLEETERARNPGEFDFGIYSRSQGYCCQVYGEELRVIETSTIPYREGIRRFHHWCKKILMRVCKEEDLGVFQAVVLGDQSFMDPEIKEMYQRHGISHILAVSGQHLTIVGGSLYLILRRLGLRQAGAGIAGGILVMAYGILTGSSGSAMRAVVMILCLWLAAAAGRSYDSLSALGLAAVLLLWQRPYLAFHSGFQLSFGAVWAIGGLGPCLCEKLGAVRSWQKTWVISLCVQIVLTPIVVWHYFRHPLYGIFLNLLVMPLGAGLIYSAIGAIALGAVSTNLGRMAAGTGHFILKGYEGVCGIFEHLPGYSLLLGRPEPGQLAAYMAVLFGLLLLPLWGWKKLREIREGKEGEKEKSFDWKGFLWCFDAYFLCLIFLWPRQTAGLRITCLDVGQGDGIVVEWKDGVLLIDGGSSSRSGLGEECLEPFLESRGISEIWCALVSHGDNDHISGLVELLGTEAEIKIHNLILPEVGKGEEIYQKLESLAQEKGADVFYMESGDRISRGGLEFHCLFGGDPIGGTTDRNKQSLAVEMSFEGFHMLFTGDMDQECESQLLERTQPETLPPIHLLKVAHHGSDTSSSQEFLDAVSPRAAVISYGIGNSYGHPSPHVLERLRQRDVRVWETGKTGAVIIQMDEGVLQIQGYLREGAENGSEGQE